MTSIKFRGMIFMKKAVIILSILALFISFTGCSSKETPKSDKTVNVSSSENIGEKPLSEDFIKQTIEEYKPENRKPVAKIGDIIVEKSSIEDYKNKNGVSNFNVKKKFIRNVVIYKYVRDNELFVSQSTTQIKNFHDSFKETDKSVVEKFSEENMSEMGLSKEELLERFNFISDVSCAQIYLDQYLLDRVVKADWQIEDKKLNKMYQQCVENYKIFLKDPSFFEEEQKYFLKFCNAYYDYLVEQANVEYL